MAFPNTVTNGNFQDSLGNVVANGSVTFQLNQDAVVNTDTLICSDYEISYPLNQFGDLFTGDSTLWPNDILTPLGTFYIVKVYSANGQLVWGPNYCQILSSPSPFDVGVLVP